MELSKNTVENGVVVHIIGEIDAATVPELTDYFKEQIRKEKNLIVDFSKVEYISSAGLRVLLATLKETRKIEGDLRLASVLEVVYKILKISGFTSFLKIYPDLDEAVNSFKA